MKKISILLAILVIFVPGCSFFRSNFTFDKNSPTCPPGLCSSGLGHVIYGEDNRLDMYKVRNIGVRENALAVGSLWYDNQIRRNGDIYELLVSGYGSTYGLAPREPFRDQVIGPHCTVFLVAPDIVVTAGHCLNSNDFLEKYVIFGFRMIDQKNCTTIVNRKNVYKVKKIIAHQLRNDGMDYAIIKLDRKVEHIIPLRVSDKEVKKGDWLYVLGHPCGLPLKYAPCARVMSTSNKIYFNASLDTYGGNSGSPVFNDSGDVVGILVRGETDFIDTSVGKVSRTGVFGESCTKSVNWKKYVK
jgi:hypothetical protein